MGWLHASRARGRHRGRIVMACGCHSADNDRRRLCGRVGVVPQEEPQLAVRQAVGLHRSLGRQVQGAPRRADRIVKTGHGRMTCAASAEAVRFACKQQAMPSAMQSTFLIEQEVPWDSSTAGAQQWQGQPGIMAGPGKGSGGQGRAAILGI